MKLNCGPSPEAKAARREREFQRLQDWHSFFAILPRRVGENDCRMFERIERKGTLYQTFVMPGFSADYVWSWKWEYRAVQS